MNHLRQEPQSHEYNPRRRDGLCKYIGCHQDEAARPHENWKRRVEEAQHEENVLRQMQDASEDGDLQDVDSRGFERGQVYRSRFWPSDRLITEFSKGKRGAIEVVYATMRRYEDEGCLHFRLHSDYASSFLRAGQRVDVDPPDNVNESWVDLRTPLGPARICGEIAAHFNDMTAIRITDGPIVAISGTHGRRGDYFDGTVYANRVDASITKRPKDSEPTVSQRPTTRSR